MTLGVDVVEVKTFESKLIQFENNRHGVQHMKITQIILMLFGLLLILETDVQAGASVIAKKTYPFMANSRGKLLKDKSIAKKEFILLYFSASWCGPCKRFTPKLVDFYNKNKSKDNFEVIFVSSDNSEKEMLKYMSKAKMPWPGIKYKYIKKSTLKTYGGKGIPCLALFDKKGKLVSHSYVKGQYVGPDQVLEDLGAILAKAEDVSKEKE
jgi:thiol-disulfide isomerase/thioredoxin